MSARILVVDDSEVTRAILARTLRGAGFEVLEARDGAEGALTALRERPSLNEKPTAISTGSKDHAR